MTRGPKKTAYASDLEEAKDLVKKQAPSYTLTDVDKLVLLRVLKFPGITSAEISRSYPNMSKMRVATIRKKPAFVQALDEMQKSSADHLKEAAEAGARRLKQLIDHKDDKVALEAIKIALAAGSKTGQAENHTKRKILFQTTVTPDGALLQTVIDEENQVDQALDGG